MKCPKCKKEVPDSAKVCGYCGTLLVEKESTKTCPNCHSEVPTAVNFCRECGFKFSKEPEKVKKKKEKEEQPRIPERKAAPIKIAPQKAAAEKPKRMRAALPKWALPAAAGLVVVLAVAAYFIFFAPLGNGEKVYVPWQCEREYAYGGDEIILYYRWTTLEKEQIDAYFNVVDYTVTINDVPAAIKRDGFEEIEQNEDGNYMKLYWMDLGSFDPGEYQIETLVDIKEPVFDGWDWFGPGSDFPNFYRQCLVIVKNPQ